MEEIISTVKKIASVDWKGFSFLIDNEDYENAASSLEQLSELVSIILIVALIVSIRTLFHERGERRLRAPNVIDADILVSETDEFRCMGTILGRVNGILET